MRHPRLRHLKLAVVVLVAGFGVATLAGFLDRLFWLFELATFFRLQYAVVLGALALAALALRLFPAAVAAAILTAINLGVLMHAWAPPAAAASASGKTVEVLLANLEAGNDRYGRMAALVERTDADVVALNELSPDWARELEPSLEGYPYRKRALLGGAYGIGLYSRLPLEHARIARFPVADGPPTVVAELELAGEPVTFVLTHVHTPFAGSIHERQLQALAAARPEMNERLVVCGDFNAVPWSGPLGDLRAEAGLHGSSDALDASWPTWGGLLGVPLDDCLTSDGVAVVSRSRGPDIGSDHYPLIVELAVPPGGSDGS